MAIHISLYNPLHNEIHQDSLFLKERFTLKKSPGCRRKKTLSSMANGTYDWLAIEAIKLF